MRGILAGLVMCFSSAALAQNEVDQREANQQQRIDQGEKSGELTNHEANHLERQQAHIDNQVARDRAANGGHLTKAEHAQVNREQDRASRNIYRKKHNARVK